MEVLFTIGFIISLLAVFPVYGYVGSTLKKNYFVWGVIGWGIMISFIIVAAPGLYFFDAPYKGVIYWTSISLFSPIFSLLVAVYITYHTGLFSKKTIAR